MATYHLDCASGIAGDMFLGACLDLGMPLEVIAEAVASLGLRGVGVEQRKAVRGGFAGTRFRVLVDGVPIEGPDPEEVEEVHGHGHQHGRGQAHGSAHEPGHEHEHGHRHEHGDDHEHGHREAHQHEHGAAHEHEQGGTHREPPPGGHDPRGQRDLTQIRLLLAGSGLQPAVRERALVLFTRLGEAEAKAHAMPLAAVHFHEVGAVDSIVDLVGAAAAVEHLAPERLTCGPVNVGGGRVKTDHGELPVPTPATAELLAGIPIYGGPGGELTTPTGAVLLAELVDGFVELPAMVLERTGYGLGRRDLAMQPNALRLLRGRAAAPRPFAAPAVVVAGDAAAPEVAVVECEVDDLAGEGFGFLMERLLAAGALDAYFTPLVMKKSRPGTLVSLLCRRNQVEELAGILLLESGSLGCRYHMAARIEAERDAAEVATPFGPVRIKRGQLAGRTLALAPEYEDCRRLALAAGVPWREVYQAALAAAATANAAAVSAPRTPAGS
jgi:pyridinium-3,5-bisthiocarboxylic acid mononucleotide nickel chelatase